MQTFYRARTPLYDTLYRMTQKHVYIFGLGNPGVRYEHTRHNAGKDAVLRFADTHHLSWRTDTRCVANISEQVHIGDSMVQCVIPQTYMNESGTPVACVRRAHEQVSEMIVVHDDIDLPMGTIRIVRNRGAGGHHGVSDIMRHIGTGDFIRVRIGVLPVNADGTPRKPSAGTAVVRFVLRKVGADERNALDVLYTRAAEALQLLLTSSYEKAVQAIHEKNVVHHTTSTEAL